jgi:hypothetical protein
MGSPAFNKALAQNVAAEKVQMYGQVRVALYTDRAISSLTFEPNLHVLESVYAVLYYVPLSSIREWSFAFVPI